MALCIVIFCALLVLTVASTSKILSFRGGLVPQASGTGEDYYEQFDLDYGSKDRLRIAGSMRGFIKSGNIASLPESDAFYTWLNIHLEQGPDEGIHGRLKPFYAADFGEKADLLPGENPKLIIVNRKLETDENGMIVPAPKEIDVEIRDIWQPWLKRKCDFVVRYIVPNRVNIIKILESKKKFRSEVEVIEDEEGKQQVRAKLVFKPSLMQRLLGKRDIVMNRNLPASLLDDSKVKAKRRKGK